MAAAAACRGRVNLSGDRRDDDNRAAPSSTRVRWFDEPPLARVVCVGVVIASSA
jgi:hypothetical protein